MAQAEFFHQMCANVEMRPSDWPCAITETRTVAAQVGSSLFTWVAVALSGALLAASGRRYTWAIPTAFAAVATVIDVSDNSERLFGVTSLPIGSGHPSGFWFEHPVASVAGDLLLVSIPAAAVAFVLRPSRRLPAPAPKRHASWVATCSVVGAIAGMQMLWSHLQIPHLVQPSFGHSLVATGLIALTAAMLGTDRRFWPWALVPAAILLSLGPTMAVAGIPARFVTLTWFAAVAPLGFGGMIGSLWRPIAMRLSGERTPTVRTPVRRPLRPVVVLHALAIGMLAASLIAVRNDPLPYQLAMGLPTYLGVRDAAFDTRTEMNLLLAIEALERHEAEHGSFAGFDVADGERLAPEMDWTDRGRVAWPLRISLADVSRTQATVVVRSATGSVFCARTDGASATYGSAAPRGHGFRDPTVVSRAVAACDERTLTSDVVATVDLDAMCAVADEYSLMPCRAVQRNVADDLASPTID
jgi:hypothetical protein